MGVAVRTTAQRRSLAHTFLGQGVFNFQFDPWSACGCRAPGVTSVFYRDLAEDLSALSRQSAEISWSENLPLRARERPPRELRPLAHPCRHEVRRDQHPTWPSRALAALALLLGQDWERAARSMLVRPWRQRRLHLGLGAALSDQLSWSAPQTYFPVKRLLTFPSSATTKPSSEVRSRTRLQVPHQPQGAAAARTRRSTHSVCE